jgi:hypothetical protein
VGLVGTVKTLKNFALALYAAFGPWLPAAAVTAAAVVIKVTLVSTKGSFNGVNGTFKKLAHL